MKNIEFPLYLMLVCGLLLFVQQALFAHRLFFAAEIFFWAYSIGFLMATIVLLRNGLQLGSSSSDYSCETKYSAIYTTLAAAIMYCFGSALDAQNNTNSFFQIRDLVSNTTATFWFLAYPVGLSLVVLGFVRLRKARQSTRLALFVYGLAFCSVLAVGGFIRNQFTVLGGCCL